MNTHQINDFLIVVDTKSINKAATQLYISPQALHQQLDRMEDELGFKLLKRTKKGCYLTVAGKVFYQGIKRLNEQYLELVNKSKLESKRTMRKKILTLSSGTFQDFEFNKIR